jgi:hypothetical protein
VALREGKLPSELADVALMRFMGWSWQELCACPAHLVRDIRTYMRKSALIAKER